MVNFLQETKEVLVDQGYKRRDLAWIGSKDGAYVISWSSFKELANFEYDSGYGSQKIPADLVIVMKDGSWFDRYEYDGSEYWVYNRLPVLAPSSKKITRLQHCHDEYWCSVADMQEKRDGQST